MHCTSTPTLSAPLPPETEPGRQVCTALDELGGFLTEQAVGNDARGCFADASIRRLVEAGLLAACVPVEYGGYGLTSLLDLAVFVGRIARYDASVAVASHMHLVLSWYYARTVRLAPAGEQRERHHEWLRAIGRREMIVCSAVAEIGGSAWRPHATAAPCDSGWRINGRKLLASISPAATHFYARVRAETKEGPRQGSVMIPASSPGVSVVDNWNGLGLRGSGSGEVHFNDVLVARGEVVDRGHWGVRDDRSFEGRVASLAPLIGVTAGIAEAALTAGATSYRDGAGRNSSARATVVMAELEVGALTCRAAMLGSLRHFDQVLGNRAPRTLSSEDSRALMKECICCGILVERTATTMVDLAMEACGARSYRADHPLARLCRDVRASFFMRPYTPADGWADFVAGVTSVP